jgi:cytoskeletal protein CcmA (bactofilin family)
VGRIAPLLVVALALLALPAPALADGPKDQVVITGTIFVGPLQRAGTIVIFDGPTTIRGVVTGDVVSFHGPVRVLGGHVNGDITAFNNQVVIGPRGSVGGDVNYGDKKPFIAPGARVGGKLNKFDTATDQSPLSGLAFTLLWWLAVTVSSLVLGIVMIALWPRSFETAAAVLRRSPGASIGWGLLIVIGIPVAGVIALISLVGIPLGVGLFLALVPLYVVGYVTSAFLVGRLILKEPTSRILAFLLGLAILQVVTLIPILGPLVWIAGVILGLGALVVASWRANHPPAAPAAPAAPVAPA